MWLLKILLQNSFHYRILVDVPEGNVVTFCPPSKLEGNHSQRLVSCNEAASLSAPPQGYTLSHCDRIPAPI